MLKGIRKAAEKSQLNNAVLTPSNVKVRNATPEKVASAEGSKTIPGYGRARLWLGISGVGTMVTLASLMLFTGFRPSFVPEAEASMASQTLGLVCFFAIYILIQFPFDFLGGYWLPQKFGRAHPSLGLFVSSLLRGALVHGALLLSSACVLMVAGRYVGSAGSVLAGLSIAFLLLYFRLQLAQWVSQLHVTIDSARSAEGKMVAQQTVLNVQCHDEGFTGGFTGVFAPKEQLFSTRWREVLGPDGTALALHRRTLAVKTQSWLRGRVLALLFTATGLLAASLLVGGEQLGTAWGIIQFSLWFSLWSFVGLLTLPTLSRRGVIEIDERTQADGYPVALMRDVTERLDRLQDGEPVRPSIVETIFHPVPSIENRLDGPRSHQVLGFWDAARTSIYISSAGLGLLGRAVHCNCGRPSLWVFLPTD
jgi:hypothetical protein